VSIDISDYPWLQFDWNTFGKQAITSADKILPLQRLSFGQFKGNDRVIYWREKR
jgi:MSHA biogenesis protein MshQ